MKILLIDLCRVQQTSASIGLLTIASYLKKHIDVTFDYYSNSYFTKKVNDIKKNNFIELKQYSSLYDIVAISYISNTNNKNKFLQNFIKKCKQYVKYNKLIIGGWVVSSLKEKILDYGVDAACFGEGEIPMLEYCQAYLNNTLEQYLKNSESWYSKYQNLLIPRKSKKINLNEIPPMDLSISNSTYKSNILRVQFTRGCPNHCKFCSIKIKDGTTIRKLSIENIEKYLIYYNKVFNIKFFLFIDDNSFFPIEYWEKILNIFERHKNDFKIHSFEFCNFTNVTEDFLKRVMALTTYNIYTLSIDAENEENYKEVKPNACSLEHLREISRIINKYNGIVTITLIVGYQSVKNRNINDFLDWCKSFNTHIIRVYLLAYYNDTIITNNFEKLSFFKKALLKFKVKRFFKKVHLKLAPYIYTNTKKDDENEYLVKTKNKLARVLYNIYYIKDKNRKKTFFDYKYLLHSLMIYPDDIFFICRHFLPTILFCLFNYFFKKEKTHD
jgi:biotin synthase-like enzyme